MIFILFGNIYNLLKKCYKNLAIILLKMEDKIKKTFVVYDGNGEFFGIIDAICLKAAIKKLKETVGREANNFTLEGVIEEEK